MRKILIVLLILITAAALSAVSLSHNNLPVIRSDVQIILVIDEGFDDVQDVDLMIRDFNDLDFRMEPMNLESAMTPEYSLDLEKTELSGKVQYYFSVYLEDGSNITLPYDNPELNPYQTEIISDEKVSQDFVLLSPDPMFPSDELIVVISYFNLADKIDPNSIIVSNNNRDVTGKAKISDNMIVLDLSKFKGVQKIQVEAKTKDSSILKSEEWHLKNRGYQESEQFEYSGDVTIKSWFKNENYSYDDEDIEDEDEDDSRNDLTMNFKGAYKKLDIKSRIYLSSNEDEDKQPVNRYKLEMRVPYFRAIAGDHTPNYNTLMTTGKNIRGFHGKLFFPGFAIYSSIGSSKRKINGEKEDNLTSAISYTGGTFSRYALVTRMEMGSKSNFLMGLNFTKSKDRIKSLNKKYYLAQDDSSHIAQPKDNIVLGTDMRLALFNQKLVWAGEFAVSLYNDDIIGGAISRDSLETEFDTDIPFDPEDFESIFVINKNVEPIIPSLSSMAYKTSLKYLYRSNIFNISYRGVGASYRALSANYLGQDSRVLSIMDNLSLMRNQLNLSIVYNYISDNLYDEKEETTSSNNIFTQIYYRPKDLPYIGFSYNGFSAENSYETTIDDDSLSFNQGLDLHSNNFYIYTGYELKQLESAPTNINLSYGNSSYKDEEQGMFEYKKNTIGFSANTRFRELPLKTTISYTFSKNENESVNTIMTKEDKEITENTYHSVYFKGLMRFMEDKVKPYMNLRFINESGDFGSNTFNAVLGSTYKVLEQLLLSSEIGYKSRSYEDYEVETCSAFDFRFKAKYTF